ncbi:hypothetical protein [Luteolibacter sp. AS25]|uniref:hypothetical protein n=1 Tax=Luteolibacter sp. AS25 TaxID=3135776 RepID=UPI00398A8453
MKIKMSWARRAALIAGMILATGEESWGGDFIRVKETEEFAKLQTAVFGYERDGVEVDLVGAIHIADKAYYEFLNGYFENYEVLLFEMVGGEALGGGKRPAAIGGKQEGDAGKMDGLKTIYESLEKALGLTGQAGLIDYFADNFVHADLTMEEFDAMQEENGESMIGFMIQAGMAAEKPKRDPDTLRLMRGILTGRSDLVKLEMMKTMEDGDSQVDSLSGENVIIKGRNEKCLEVMDQQIQAGKKKIGIFYGAAHFPDMERRMEERGFAKTSSKWATAWRVPKS